MATLQNSTIQDLTITDQTTVNGEITSTPEAVATEYRTNTGYTATGAIPFTNFYVSNKITRSNNNSRFTVLEPGLYYVMWHNISSAQGDTTRTRIYVNGSNWSQARGEGTPNYPMVNAFVLNFMDEGDYFEMVHTNGTVYLTSQYTDFTIFKVT